MPDGPRIGYYLRPLRQHSLLIAIIVALGLVGGLIIALLFGQVLPYEAQSILLFKGNDSDRLVLTQDANFQALTLDPASQTRNLQVLISSLDVAQKVKDRASADTDPDIKAIGAMDVISLQGVIQVEVKSALIYISAGANTPKKATWLANAWTAEAVTKINQIYALSSSRVDEALADAQTQLSASENALQEFLSTSKLNSLRQELEQTHSFIASATESYTNTQFALYNTERSQAQENLATAYASLYNLKETTGEIAALRTRVEQGPDQLDALYGNQVTLIILMNKLVAANTGPQLQLQVSATGGTATLNKTTQLAEVDATQAAARKLQTDLLTQIDSLETTLRTSFPVLTADSIANVPDALQAQIQRQNELQSSIEDLTFEYNQLLKTRDLRQSAYDLLRNRLAEQQVNEVISRIVDIGSPANELEAARSRSPVRIGLYVIGQSVLLALVLGIILAYLLHLLRPNFSTNTLWRRSSARVAPTDSSG